MASPAHCFYCFESLASHFESGESLSLEDILKSYEAFRQNGDGVNSRGIDLEDLEEDDMDDEQEPDIGNSTSSTSKPVNPSISRLLTSTPQSGSSSSSTPSLMSANSSNVALTNASSTTSISTPPSYASRLSITASYPLFVTWNTISRSSGHRSLRGCIGTFEAMPLGEGLQTYALTSALDDTRFSPIPASLMPSLSCSLTLLADFENCDDAMDWTVGKHGLRISFTSKGRRYGATYLPDVAVEQGWTKEETLESLMKKAGWDGGSSRSVARRLLRGSGRSEVDSSKPWEEVPDFKAVRYTGLKASVSYAEWQEWKKWNRSSKTVI